MNESALIIFAREPKDGKVKTRLGEELSPTAITQLYEAFIKDVVGVALKIKCDQRLIFYATDNKSIPFLRGFDKHFQLRPQEGDTLGTRMHRAFEYCHKNHFKRIIIVGTDCVTLTVTDIEEAFEKLKDHDCVLGPAQDGGYYLIGLKSPEAKLFERVEWGTARVLDQTIRRTGELNKITFLLREDTDVDTMSDLKELSRRIKGTNIAAHTQKVINRGQTPR